MGGPVSRLALVAIAAGLLAVAGCGGGGGSSAVNNGGGGGGGGGGSASNSQSISANLGPTGNYVNGVFTNVTVCVPGTANCQTIPVLVDTGSSGLRLLASGAAGGQLSLALPQENASTGSPLVECAQFASGSTWGPIKLADIQLAGETASSVPIQVIDTSTYNTIPQFCPTPFSNTLNDLGTYGLLGVGVFRQDCGSGCTAPGFHVYFSCAPPSTCTEVGATLAQQAQNPVWMFSSSDNNGVVIELPQIAAGGALTAAGTILFGIGTQSNNALGSATVMTTAADGTLSTTFNGTTYTETFVDTGSNGYFILSSGLTGMPLCPDGSGFYCPATTQSFMAINKGANGASSAVNFSVSDEQTLFSTNNAAFNDLGGENTLPPAFDWGLPFFYGRTVFVGIEGQSTPGGTGPYFAY